MPSGSRKPITASGESSTAANAPRMRDIVSMVASRRLPGMLGDQRADDLGVGRRVEVHAARDELVAQLGRVREVAVVAERDGAAATVADDRLRVLPGRRAGRRVARVADRGVADERLQLGLVEDLRDEAHLAQRRHAPPVGDRDARALLPAVLQRVHAEVGEPRDVAARARRCRRRRTSARLHRQRERVLVGRARIGRARRRPRTRRRARRSRSPPSCPSSATGTPWRAQISTSRSRRPARRSRARCRRPRRRA